MSTEQLSSIKDIYDAICAVTAKQPPGANLLKTINSFVVHRHGMPFVALPISDTLTEEQKRETLREIVIALRERQLERLAVPEGSVRVNVARMDPPKLAPVEIVESVPPPVRREPVAGESGGLRMADVTTDAGEKSLVGELKSVMARLMDDFKPKAAELDEGRVSKLIADAITKYDHNLADIMGRLRDEVMANSTPKIEVTIAGVTNAVEGATHRQFPQVLTWLSANVPLWLWGKAGAGKTHLFYQLAEAMGIDPYVVSIDPTTTINKLLGYRNLATGEFVEGLLYKPYKNGGLAGIDEVDTGDQGVIAGLNALLANAQFMFPNGELVKRHTDFRIIAGANTKGTGAVAGYTARTRLDAATLDRFAIVELEYDEGLELGLSCGQKIPPATWKAGEPASEEKCLEFVRWIQKVRQAANNSVLVSPRASYNAVKALRCGIPAREVAEALVFKLVSDDTRTTLLNRAGGVPQ